MALFRRRTGPVVDELTIRRALSRLLEIAQDPNLSDWEWVEVLTSEGFDHKMAMRLVAFAPLAFGRAQLSDRTGFTFSPMYEVRSDRASTERPIPLASAPEFVVAEGTARQLDPSDPGFHALAFRGAEIACVMEMERRRNGPVNELIFTDALILWDIL